MRRSAIARRRLLFCQNLGAPPLMTPLRLINKLCEQMYQCRFLETLTKMSRHWLWLVPLGEKYWLGLSFKEPNWLTDSDLMEFKRPSWISSNQWSNFIGNSPNKDKLCACQKTKIRTSWSKSKCSDKRYTVCEMVYKTHNWNPQKPRTRWSFHITTCMICVINRGAI